MTLLKDNNMGEHGDHLYNILLDAHKGLTIEQSQRLNARLVLILMNQVGSVDVVEEAIAIAKKNVINSD